MAFFRSLLLGLRDLAFGARRLPSRIVGRVKRAFYLPKVEYGDAPLLSSGLRLKTLGEFETFVAENVQLVEEIRAFEASLVRPIDLFAIDGYCVACLRETSFLVDFQFSDGRTPNWRERLICVRCKLPNRARAMLDFLESTLQLPKLASVYVTEQSTPFFRALAGRYRNAVGSEFRGPSKKPGSVGLLGVRNEDMTHLSFADGIFETICTADVLEHVPDYKRALAECYRCLKPGGTIVVSVPFLLGSHETLVRARAKDDGSTEYLEPAEYHGDPLRGEGALCYYHFGWDFLDGLAGVGFSGANLCFYWSPWRGYLGGLQFLISAIKPGATDVAAAR